jgi:hypothetical protein
LTAMSRPAGTRILGRAFFSMRLDRRNASISISQSGRASTLTPARADARALPGQRDGGGRPEGGLSFGAIACFDLATEAAQARSRAATRMQTAADSEQGRVIRSTDESRSPPIRRQHFHIFGELW